MDNLLNKANGAAPVNGNGYMPSWAIADKDYTGHNRSICNSWVYCEKEYYVSDNALDLINDAVIPNVTSDFYFNLKNMHSTVVTPSCLEELYTALCLLDIINQKLGEVRLNKRASYKGDMELAERKFNAEKRPTGFYCYTEIENAIKNNDVKLMYPFKVLLEKGIAPILCVSVNDLLKSL